MTKSAEVYDIPCRIKARTSMAILIDHDGNLEHEVWLPLSQTEVGEANSQGIVIVTIPEWLASKKGLL